MAAVTHLSQVLESFCVQGETYLVIIASLAAAGFVQKRKLQHVQSPDAGKCQNGDLWTLQTLGHLHFQDPISLIVTWMVEPWTSLMNQKVEKG